MSEISGNIIAMMVARNRPTPSRRDTIRVSIFSVLFMVKLLPHRAAAVELILLRQLRYLTHSPTCFTSHPSRCA